MTLSLLKRAAVSGAAVFALASTAAHAQSVWTTFTAGQLDSFSFTHAHHADGRFLFGKGGVIQVQDTWGAAAFTAVANPGAAAFDPAFIAVRDASSALIGGGGFPSNLALLPFDPSTPAAGIGAPLVTPNPQTYAGAWWAHPTSGRQGWLITGNNGVFGENNITFISADGAAAGPVTLALSSFSGGITVAANGDVITVLADFNPAVDNQVLRFTADQIDAAVAAVLAAMPAPLAAVDAANPLRADASSSVAVDALGRLWVGGWQIPHLQLWDPVSGISRRVSPLADSPANHAGPPNFAVKAFSQGGGDRVSFLAHDSFYSSGSDLVLGHAAVGDIEARAIEFASSALTFNEGDGTLQIELVITPPPAAPVTVPVTLSGTAENEKDYTVTATEVVCTTSTATFEVHLTDDTLKGEPDETLVLTLGRPEPHEKAGLGRLGTEVCTITIQDNDVPPIVAAQQNFPDTIRVGASFFHQMLTSGPASPVTRWQASGLPPGLRIDPLTGVISGTPTTAGDFDRVLITAQNASGKTTSTVFLLSVQPLPAATVGSFTGFHERDAANNGLGARVDLTTTRSGAYTATVTIGKQRLVTRGVLDASGAAPAGVLNLGSQTLAFTVDAASGALSGAMLTGWANAAQAERSGACHFMALSAGNPDDQPQGASHGKAVISARGGVRVSGRTADGSVFTTSSALGVDGRLLVYQTLYRVPGTFCGVLAIADDALQAVNGALTWSKPAQTSGALYRDGWPAPQSLAVMGGRYRPVAGATLPLDAAPTGGDNATLFLEDGGIEAFGDNPRASGVRIVSASRVTAAAPLKLTLNNRSGVIGGKLPLAQGADKRTASFSGLLIPTGDPAAPFATRGCGYFVLPTAAKGVSRSGLLELSPNP